MSEKIERRRRMVAALEELQAAGLLRFTLSSEDLEGPEPHLEIFASSAAVLKPAPSTVGRPAARLWEALRTGQGPSLTVEWGSPEGEPDPDPPVWRVLMQRGTDSQVNADLRYGEAMSLVFAPLSLAVNRPERVTWWVFRDGRLCFRVEVIADPQRGPAEGA